MHDQPIDRPPLYDFNYLDVTIPAWHAQRLPEHLTRWDTGAWLGRDVTLGGGGREGYRPSPRAASPAGAAH